MVSGIAALDDLGVARKGFDGYHALRSVVRIDTGRIGPAKEHDQRDAQSGGDMTRTGVVGYDEFGVAQQSTQGFE